jgi:hypothetical protein
MLRKLLVLTLVLGVSIALAKTYTINIARPAQVGTAELKPGQYSLKVEGNKVVLTSRTDRNTVELEAKKVETAERKFDNTAIVFREAEGKTTIRSIALGGSNLRVIFEE